MVLAVALVAFVLEPGADGPWLETRWRGEETCVDAEALSERVEALLGTDHVPPSTALTLDVAPSDRGWNVELSFAAEEQTVERTLQGTDCQVLTEAIALVIAVNANPVAVAASVEQPVARAVPEPASLPARPTPHPKHEEPPQPRPTAVRSRPHASILAGVGATVGDLPRASAAIELGAAVVWKHARFEVGGLALVGPDVQAGEVPSVSGRFRLYAAVIRGCGVLGRRALELPICGGLEVGALRARGLGLEQARAATALWIAPVVGVRPRWVPVRRLAFGVFADAAIHVLRPRFSTGDAGVLYGVPAIAGRFGLLVEVRLP